MGKLAKNSISSKVNEFTFNYFGIEPKQTSDQYSLDADLNISLNETSPLANRFLLFEVNEGNKAVNHGDRLIASTISPIFRGNLVVIRLRDENTILAKFVNMFMNDGEAERIYIQRIPRYNETAPEPEEIGWGEMEFMYRIINIIRTLDVRLCDF